MASADQYAEWIVKNADKKGTEEFNTVAQAYKEAQQQEQANKGIGARLAEQTGKEIESVKAAPVRATTDIVNRGLIGNTLGGPVDIINAGVRAYHALSNAAMSPFGYENKWQPSEAPVGGGEWFGQQMQQANMVSPERRPVLETAAGLAPIAPAAARGAANLVKTAVMTPINVAKGIANAPETSLYKIDDYYKPAAVEGYKQGLITKQELQNPENIIPRQQMFQSPTERMAARISGNQVPARGKIAEATGERIAQDYGGRYGPLALAADIATPLVSGGFIPPPLLTRRIAQGLSDRYLGGKYNYDPEFLAKYRADTGVPPTPPPAAPPSVPPGGMPPPLPPSPPPPVNTNIPAFQRANRNIPGVNGPAVPPVEPPAAPTPPPAGSVAGPAVPQLTYRPTPTTMYAGQYGAAGGDINQVAAADFANKYNPALNFKPSLPPAAQAPAQAAATQAGITPPINAIESGFNKELAPATGMNALGLSDTSAEKLQQLLLKEQTGVLTKSEQMMKQLYERKLGKTETPAPALVVKTSTPNPVEAPVSGPVIPEVNPEAAQVAPRRSLADIQQNIANRPLGQVLAEDAQLQASINRSTAQAAAQGARSNLLEDIKSYTSVSKKDNRLTYDKDMFNEMAQKHGVEIDWTAAPDISKMKLGEGRKEIRKFVYNQVSPTRRGASKVSDDTLNTLFEEAPTTSVNTPAVKKNEMTSQSLFEGDMTPVKNEKPMTKAQIKKQQEFLKKQDEMMKLVQTPYIEGTTGENQQTFNNLVEHMRNRPYMAGVERSKERVKSTGEVFTPTPLVDEILKNFDPKVFKDPTQTFLDPAAGDGQFLSEAVLRKIQNGSTHKQAIETTYGVDIKADNVKLLRDRLLAGREDLRPTAENNILVGNALDPFEKVPGQTANDHRRMIEVFGGNDIEKLKQSKNKADLKKAQELEIYAKSIGADIHAEH